MDACNRRLQEKYPGVRRQMASHQVASSPLIWYGVFFAGETGFVMEDLEELKARLSELKNEHRDLDEIIHDLTNAGPYDQIKLQRLKKRKLQLKDHISKLEDGLLPDIIA